METDDPFEFSLSDERLDDGDWDFAESESPTGSAARQRREEYEVADVDKADRLEVTLADCTADLMDIASSVGAVVKNSLAAMPATADSVVKIEPVLTSLLRVSRQIDRYGQLELRIANARVQAQNAKHQSQPKAMFSPVTQPSRRIH